MRSRAAPACAPETIPYRGRIAPSPTGHLHVGHATTFWRAQTRSRERGGKLILRIEDLDRARCLSEFAEALIEDLTWFGLRWDEGPFWQATATIITWPPGKNCATRV